MPHDWAVDLPFVNDPILRADATLDEGWFYEAAGIYRHVWLTKTSPVHIAQWGNYVRPHFGTVPGVASGGSVATLLITTEVTNSGNDDAAARVRATILHPAGKAVATAGSDPATIDSRETRTLKLMTRLGNPKLWSLETPSLYRAVIRIEVDCETVDEDTTTFGVRTLKFDANRGFLLNGKPVKIKGTRNHQDHAGVGAAIPDRIQEYRIERLQWMGSKGCRTSQNPPTPEFLAVCDRKGMLVMDETRMMSSSPEGLSQLERLIKRDRNHPSVIIWSLANEKPEQGNTRGARIVNTMKHLQRKLDPSRVCTTAMNDGWGGVDVSTAAMNPTTRRTAAPSTASAWQSCSVAEANPVTSRSTSPLRGYSPLPWRSRRPLHRCRQFSNAHRLSLRYAASPVAALQFHLALARISAHAFSESA